jgi:hypothetical protein
MAVKVQTKIPNFKALNKRIEKEFRTKVKAIHTEVTNEAKKILTDSIIEGDKVATGNLLKSVSARFVSDKSVDGFTSQVGFKKPGSTYASYSNYGRGSGGMPPANAMRRWARAVGFPLEGIWALRKKIAQDGTEDEGQDAFYEKAVGKIETMMKRTVSKRLKELKGKYK